jgi:hypothetical protein
MWRLIVTCHNVNLQYSLLTGWFPKFWRFILLTHMQQIFYWKANILSDYLTICPVFWKINAPLFYPESEGSSWIRNILGIPICQTTYQSQKDRSLYCTTVFPTRPSETGESNPHPNTPSLWNLSWYFYVWLFLPIVSYHTYSEIIQGDSVTRGHKPFIDSYYL